MNPDDGVATLPARLSREAEARHRLLELVIRNSPVAMAMVRGPDYTYEMVNSAYQALAPGEPMAGRTMADVWPEAAPLAIPILNMVLETGDVYRATEFAMPRSRRPERPGVERYFDLSCVPLPPMEEARVLVTAIEVTRHERAGEELRAAYSELNNSDDCGEATACGQCPLREAALDSLAHGTHHQGVEVWQPRSVQGFAAPRRLLVSTAVMNSEKNRKVLVCAQDITELKRTQLALESALAEKTILLKEIHHRVKNNLAVVSSLLSMKADHTRSAEAKLALEESQRRLYSMALIHEHLYGNDRLDRIDFAQYARQLVNRLHAAFASEPGRIAIELNLTPIELGIERAVPCGLILNELLTNAFKYAFRGRTKGRIAVSFRQSPPGMEELTVEDDGVGLAAEARNGNSLGLRIVEVLTRQLDGTLTQEPCSGTRMVLRFPAVGDNRTQCAQQ